MICFNILFYTTSCFSQERKDQNESHFNISIGSLHGSKRILKNQDYIGGNGIYVMYKKPISAQLAISVTTGFERFKNENFYPFYLTSSILSKSGSLRTFDFDFGYSIVASRLFSIRQNRYQQGGRVMGIGISQFLAIGHRNQISFGLKVKHQRATEIKAETRMNSNYLIFSLSLGLSF
jgi:hypothetical protein